MPDILMLHRVLPEYAPDNYYFQRGTAITWNSFITLLDNINKNGLRALPLSALEKQPRNSIFLTFDDGYADNAQALNELLHRGMTATVFPVKDFVREGFSPIDDMACHLMESDIASLQLRKSLTNGRLKKLLRRISSDRYRHLRDRWFGLTRDARPSTLFLNEKQLSDFSSRGIELGIHGSSHRTFNTLSEEILVREIKDSQQWLRSLGASEPLAICFPHGAHDQRTIDICLRYSQTLLGVDAETLSPVVMRRVHVREGCNWTV